MHFVADKDVFYKTIQRALAVMDTDLELPVFQGIRVDVRDGMAWLSSSSPGISCAIRMPLKTWEGEGVILLPAKRVLEVVKVLKGDAKVSETEADLVIASGRSRFTVKKFKNSDSFDPAAPPDGTTYEPFDSKKLAQAVRKISSGVGIKDDKPQTQVVHFNEQHLVVTDLSYLAVATNTYFPIGGPLNLNRGLLQAALKSLGESNSRIAFNPDKVVMVGDDSCVQLNRAVISYPPYQNVHGLFRAGKEAVFERDSLVAALDEALVAAENDHVVGLQIGLGRVQVSSWGKGGSATAEAPCDYQGPEVCLFTNASLMSKGIRQFTSKTLRAKILESMKPLMFYEEGYEFYAAPCRDPGGSTK